MRTVCRVSVVSLTFIIISSVLPWTTASGLMMAKVQVFSAETAVSEGSAVSVSEALGRPPAGTRQPLRTAPGVPSPGLPAVSLQTWTLVDAPVCLQTSTSTWLQGTLTCRGHKPGRKGLRRGRGAGGEDQRLLRSRNPEATERVAWMGESWSRGSAGLATIVPSCHTLVILGLCPRSTVFSHGTGSFTNAAF